MSESEKQGLRVHKKSGWKGNYMIEEGIVGAGTEMSKKVETADRKRRRHST